MTDMPFFAEIMFDSEPIGLADQWADLETDLRCVIECEEAPEVGGIVYFGLSTDIGETIEVRAEVLQVEEAGDLFRAQVRVVAADARLIGLVRTILSGPAAAKKDDKRQPQWAIGVKQTDGTFGVIVDSPAGLLKAEQLAKIAELSGKGAGLVKLTHAQRIILFTTPDQIGSIESELALLGLRVGVLHHGVRNIRSCCGALCRLSQGVDALGVAGRISERLYGHPTKFDVKIAVSDCARNCSEAYCADIGLLGANGKYDVVVGGRGSKVPFRAIRLAQGIDSADVAGVVVKVVEWYEQTARDGERFHALLERLGKDEVAALGLHLPEEAIASLSDGVDEAARLKAHLARAAGVKAARTALALN